MAEQDGKQAPVSQRPSVDDPGIWKAYWKAQCQPWRTEPEIDAERQKYLADCRSITPDIEKGIYPFKEKKLSRADVEWLLATHEGGRGPVDWNDESQREREGLDLRGANLCQANLSCLPLSRMLGGLASEQRKTTKEQWDKAIVKLEEANLVEIQLQGAKLNGAKLNNADLSRACLFRAEFDYPDGADLSRANLSKALLVDAKLQEADLSGADLSNANFSYADLNHANLYRSKFSGANLSQVNLAHAKLNGANLSQINLSGANLYCADFGISSGNADSRANLSGANLSKAILSHVKLANVDLSGVDLSGANLSASDLTEANLRNANLRNANLININLRKAHLNSADLSGADLFGAYLSWADFSEANLSGAILYGAYLRETNLSKANLSGADLSRANFFWQDIRAVEIPKSWSLHLPRPWLKQTSVLSGANLSEINLSKANLSGADLSRANLSGANLHGANFSGANLSGANLSGADLTGCFVYATSTWDVQLEGTIQSNLIITRPEEPPITVDNLEVAQFIYLLLNNKKIREVIDTITSKVVLILGRFTPERKVILDALREELRHRDYLPIVFDSDIPKNRDITETVSLLARMSRFVIADLTEARSIPQELSTIIPDLPSVPVQPILLSTEREYSMFEHFKRYPWVLQDYFYTSTENLLAALKNSVIEPAEQKAQELAQR